MNLISAKDAVLGQKNPEELNTFRKAPSEELILYLYILWCSATFKHLISISEFIFLAHAIAVFDQ